MEGQQLGAINTFCFAKAYRAQLLLPNVRIRWAFGFSSGESKPSDTPMNNAEAASECESVSLPPSVHDMDCEELCCKRGQCVEKFERQDLEEYKLTFGNLAQADSEGGSRRGDTGEWTGVDSGEDGRQGGGAIRESGRAWTAVRVEGRGQRGGWKAAGRDTGGWTTAVRMEGRGAMRESGLLCWLECKMC